MVADLDVEEPTFRGATKVLGPFPKLEACCRSERVFL